MPDIKQLEQGFVIVDGRIANIVDDAIDLSTDAGRAELAEFVSCAGSGVRGMPYGSCTVFNIYPKIDGPSGLKHLFELCSPKWLPDDVRAMLRKEMPDHAEEL